MARKRQLTKAEKAKRKQELAEELAASRIALSYGRGVLKEQLNVKKQVNKKLGNVFAKNPETGKLAMLEGVSGGNLPETLTKLTSNKKAVFGATLISAMAVGIVAKKRGGKDDKSNASSKQQKSKKTIRTTVGTLILGFALKRAKSFAIKKGTNYLKNKLVQGAVTKISARSNHEFSPLLTEQPQKPAPLTLPPKRQ
ncbi:hypothetical protein OAB00_01715 [Akkermansiaceae bacterium]|nr:hypothetical protein [Akkermansiaceae bacterium]